MRTEKSLVPVSVSPISFQIEVMNLKFPRMRSRNFLIRLARIWKVIFLYLIRILIAASTPENPNLVIELNNRCVIYFLYSTSLTHG